MDDDSKIIKMPNLDYEPDPKGLGHMFYHKMMEYKDKIAQIDGLTGEKQTFSSLLQRSIRVAIKLKSQGITNQDIIMSCTFNTLDGCVPLIATSFLGAKISGLDPTLSINDMVHLLKEVTPKIIFVMNESVELVEQAISQISENISLVVFGETAKHTPFPDYLQVNEEEERHFKPHEVTSAEETAFIMFSSGTSGLPKGICLNHHHFMCLCEIFRRFGYDFTCSLVTTSLYWITGNTFVTIGIMTGTTRIILPKFEVVNVFNAINKHKPTFFFAPPIQLIELYNYGIPDGINVDSIKHIPTGGTHVLPQQIINIRSVFPKAKILIGYGQTEVYMLTGFKADEEKWVLRKDIASCGKPVPGFSYRIVDVETEETLGPNQPGELRIKCQFKLNGYYKKDWSEVWDSKGWYKTGDILYYDEDHCFYIVDRIKEMLKYKSWHIPPAFIENVLTQHPAVAKCVVIGIPHEVDGDHPMAIVVLRSTHQNVTAEEIKKFVNGRVDDRKQLRGGVKIVDSFLVQLTGKIKKRVIRNMVLNGEI